MTETDTSAPIPFPVRGAGRLPYHAWLDVRFPDGCSAYSPPVGVFLDTPGMFNGWTSHVPDGAAPTEMRLDVYLRRQWRLDEKALCIANSHPAGDAAPQVWNEDSVALLCAAVREVETAAVAAGFERVCVEGADPETRAAYAGMGYVSATPDNDESDLIKNVA